MDFSITLQNTLHFLRSKYYILLPCSVYCHVVYMPCSVYTFRVYKYTITNTWSLQISSRTLIGIIPLALAAGLLHPNWSFESFFLTGVGLAGFTSAVCFTAAVCLVTGRSTAAGVGVGVGFLAAGLGLSAAAGRPAGSGLVAAEGRPAGFGRLCGSEKKM